MATSHYSDDDDDDSIEAIVRRDQRESRDKAEAAVFKGKNKAELYKEARLIELKTEKDMALHKWATVYYELFLYINICTNHGLLKGRDKDAQHVKENLEKIEKKVVARAKLGMLNQYKFNREQEVRELEAKQRQEQEQKQAKASAAATGKTVAAVVNAGPTQLSREQMVAAMDALRLPGQATSSIPQAILAAHAPTVVGQVVEPSPDLPPPPYESTAAPMKPPKPHGGMTSECVVPTSEVRNLVLKTVLGDGSCAFRSIAQGMHHGSLAPEEEKREADRLRRLVVQLLRQRGSEEMVGSGMTIEQVVLMKDNYSSYNAYCDAMSRSEYAGETEFWLLSEELEIQISIFMASDDDRGLEHLITYGTSPTPPVCLYWQRGRSEAGNHYDCLLHEEDT